MTDGKHAGADARPAPPLKPFRTMLDLEIQQAVTELKRGVRSLLVSSICAGIGVGVSVLLIVVLRTVAADELTPAVLHFIAANLYSVGFIIVILGRMDLFTEFTTIAVMPVLDRKATVGSLARFWGLVYVGNVIGAAVAGVAVVLLGRGLHVIETSAIVEVAGRVNDYSWWGILLSGIAAGWLMGALSWLIVGGRDTIRQILFIWVIAFTIGFGHLHHAIAGAVEVIAAVLVGGDFREFIRFLWWTTIGNAIGGIVLAASIHAMHEPKGADAT